MAEKRRVVIGGDAAGMRYAPPFSPVWGPVLIAARQVLKQV
jgi:hypothetical protein